MDSEYFSRFDVEEYDRKGWWLSPIMLGDDLLNKLQAGISRFLAGERDHPMAGDYQADPAKEHAVELFDYLSLQVDEFRLFLEGSPIAEVAAALAKSDEIRLFHDQLIRKSRGRHDTEVGLHSDKAYWKSCTSSNMLTAWLPLHDCDDHSGALMFLEGSHQWPDVERFRNFRSKELSTVVQYYADLGFTPRIAKPKFKRGQVSFHHCRTLHGSSANQAGIDRLAYTVHLQDGANKYTSRSLYDGSAATHRNDVLCRKLDGVCDYSDPTVCPVLWPRC